MVRTEFQGSKVYTVMSENKPNRKDVNRLKIDYAVRQKKGLPFILASTVLWTVMLAAHLTSLDTSVKNIVAMCCSALLVPVALLFGRIVRVDIFSRENPLSSLSVVAALNQLLYLPIVLWAMYEAPAKMIMIYAMVVGAHFLPYYWIYFSPTYFYASILIPAVSLILGIRFGPTAVCLSFVGFDVLICLLLSLEYRQCRRLTEG